MKKEYRFYQALDRSYWVKCYFNCHWLRWTQGFTIWGRTIYFRLSVNQVTRRLLAHELTHVAQRRRLCIFGWWWTGSIVWLIAYGLMWLWSLISCLLRWFYATCGGYAVKQQHLNFWRRVYENVWYERQAYRAMAACYGGTQRLAEDDD